MVTVWRRACVARILTIGVLALAACSATSILEPDGTIKSQEGYNIIRGPGQSDGAFVAQYQYCLTAESERKFPTVCMQDHGSSLRLSNGHIMASTQKKTRENRVQMCRNFATEFTQPDEAFNQCMSGLGEAVTTADGRVIPPHTTFRTPLAIKSAALAAVAEAPQPSTTAVSTSQRSSDVNEGMGQLLLMIAAAARQSGVSDNRTAQGASAPARADEPNSFDGMIVNYGMCGNMWGC